jgi:hypothetical protein
LGYALREHISEQIFVIWSIHPPISQQAAPATSNAGTNKFFEDFGIWKEAPVLIGSTKFEPLPDVKNIMITGGAGFM